MSAKRRLKLKKSSAAGEERETMRKDAWLCELLTRSSEEEEEEPDEKMARLGEEKYRRFEESSRWLAEANPTGWGQVAKPEAEPGPPREAAGSRGKVSACHTVVSGGESLVDRVMEALVLLSGGARAIGMRLEQIEVRMGELKKEDEKERRAVAKANPGKIQIKPGLAMMGYKCKMGRGILMLGILGIITPMESTGTEGPEIGRKLVYSGIQGLLERMAVRIEGKQSEMKEMEKNMSIKRMEFAELEKTVQRRQMLLDLTSK